MNKSDQHEGGGLWFAKMHGCGNDFVILDAISQPALLDADAAQLARKMCDRRKGIGADGALLLTLHRDADAEMIVYNADGSVPEMCGNGIRCICKYMLDHQLVTHTPMRVATGAGVLELDCDVREGRVATVTVDMGAPGLDADDIPVDRALADIGGRAIDVPLTGHIDIEARVSWTLAGRHDMRLTAVTMGNPHAVIFCDAVDDIVLHEVGPFIERHPVFGRGVNVHFVEQLSATEVRMRTWERGCGPTQACGTGASAVCVAGTVTGRTQRAITAHLPGGDLELHWRALDDHVLMTGPATEVFCGTWLCDDQTRTSSRRIGRPACEAQ